MSDAGGQVHFKEKAISEHPSEKVGAEISDSWNNESDMFINNPQS